MLAIEHGQQERQTLFDRSRLEQFLAFFQIEIQIHRDEVGEMAGIFGVERGDFDLLGEGGGKFDDFLKLTLCIAHHGGQFNGVFRHVLHQLEVRAVVRIVGHVFLDADAPETFDEDADCVVRELQHFQQPRGAADVMHFFGRGIFRFRFALHRDAEQTVAGDDVIDQLDALGRLDVERRDHSGLNDYVGKPQDRE